jgi:hypothetical protein
VGSGLFGLDSASISARMATVPIKCVDITDGTLPPVCVRCGRPSATKGFSWVSDPKAASWYLSRRMKVWGMLIFWAFILWKKRIRPGAHEREAGLPFCDRHREYWPRRAWFVVGGFLVLVILFVLMYATDSGTGSGRNHKENIFTMLAGFWFLTYLLGFVIVHMGSMRVIRHDGQRVTLVGVSKKFVAALKESLPEYAADKKPTHWQEFKQLVSEYVR